MTPLFPFTSFMAERAEVGLVLAVLLGVAFGFVLERAGFGRGPRLAAQFYLRDLTVLKVMFGAIVTAMLGLALLSGLGLADWELIATRTASWTWIWPALGGGLLLGVGFIVSGYCPGTSVVALASGHVDGLVTFGGVVIGSVVYAEFQPLLGAFPESGARGHLFLDQVVGLPPAVLGPAIALAAVAAFVAGEVAERRIGRRVPERGSPNGKKVAFSAFAGLSAVALPALAIGGEAPAAAPPSAGLIGARDLLARIVEEPWGVRVLDLRPTDACAAGRVPGAECVGPDGIAALRLASSSRARDLVVVGAAELPPEVAAFPGRAWILAGGMEAWEEEVLRAPPQLPPGASPEERDEQRLRAGVAAALTGAPQAPPPPPVSVAAVPATGGGGGCQ